MNNPLRKPIPLYRRLQLTAISFAALALSATGLRAQTAGTSLYFDPSAAAQTGAVSGTWDASTTADWSTSSAGQATPQTYSAGADAYFSAVESSGTIGTVSVTMGSAVSATGLYFVNGTTNILGADAITVGADGINVSSGATAAIGNASGSTSITASAAQTWSNGGSGTLVIGTAAINAAVTLSTGTIQLGNSGQNDNFSANASGFLIINGANVVEQLASGGSGPFVLVTGELGNSSGKGATGALTMVGTSFTFDSTKGGGVNFAGGLTLGSATLYGSQTVATNVSGYAPVFNATSTTGQTFSGALIGSATGQSLTITTGTGDSTTIAFGAGANSPALILNGAGTTGLNSDTYSGGTTLSTGTFNVNANSTVTSGAITAGPGGTGTLTINSGRVESANPNTGATLTVANNVILGGSASFGSTSATTNNGPITFDGTTLTTPATFTLTTSPTLTVTNVTTINNPIGDGGNSYTISKAGTGTLLLNAVNTFSGGVNVTAGTLGGTGTIPGPVSVAAGATIAPGPATGTGTLTTGALTLTSTTNLTYTLGTASDVISVNGALTLAGKLAVNGGAGFGAGTYDLINYTGALTNNVLTVSSLPAGYSGTIDTTSIPHEVLLDVTAVPEPSTWVATSLGLGLFAMFLHKRRRAGKPGALAATAV